jgi:hypothetical protein
MLRFIFVFIFTAARKRKGRLGLGLTLWRWAPVEEESESQRRAQSTSRTARTPSTYDGYTHTSCCHHDMDDQVRRRKHFFYPACTYGGVR